jgi:hypothetical protein
MYGRGFPADGDSGAGDWLLLEPQGGVRCQKCSKFVVAVLRCGQCVVGWSRSNGFDAMESVGYIILSRYVTHVCGELGYEVQVIELPW